MFRRAAEGCVSDRSSVKEACERATLCTEYMHVVSSLETDGAM